MSTDPYCNLIGHPLAPGTCFTPDQALHCIRRRHHGSFLSFQFNCNARSQAMQLSLAELKAVFGVPLTEAAARLGVQRQDLVRSCR